MGARSGKRKNEHVKEGHEERGTPEARAEDTAAEATVNKERARAGEVETRSPSVGARKTSGRRGGL